mmetsp:Transcript_22102/g.61351  ORF Transcript_22102/g.61351 Transcript_22102/m.61351 type:complete len:295 (-) Transcript_22102:93-977(-)|eukprot:CAMPEP_0117672516 /NCGR_PEP_ID=MMETSP0804-20121206/13948_1 /TAXON_ID=1074897 /ORGANISM="Tetraselmis astigmatica, Strain CCMP880" /LENGTH=294 /DNA_ID=CAMNT_0005481127 /DNA_START=330 /DNA_END=1214 /DNA_ORIENTATION=+
MASHHNPGPAPAPRPGMPRRGEEEESIYNLVSQGRREPPRKDHLPQAVVSRQPVSGAQQGGIRMHQNSSQIAHFLRPEEENKRPAKMDYTKANRVAVRDTSSMNHLKKMHDAVMEKDQKAKPVQRMPSQKGNAPGTAFGAPRAGPPSTAARGPAPNGKDYVRDNKARAAACKPPKVDLGPSDRERLMKKQDYGRVPAYLKARKQEMQEEVEAQEAAAEAAKIPPGMRVMPEAERMETLDILAQNKAAVEAKLMRLPFNVETPSQIQYKSGLEARLQEIEEAERMFSRPNVLVHI